MNLERKIFMPFNKLAVAAPRVLNLCHKNLPLFFGCLPFLAATERRRTTMASLGSKLACKHSRFISLPRGHFAGERP